MAQIFKPYPYQLYCIERAMQQPRIALWLEMGLGKTAIALTAIATLKFDRLAVRRVLLVAPKEVAKATWQRESQKWENTKCLQFVTIEGNAKRRAKQLKEQGDIFVISRDNIKWLVDECKGEWPFDTVILDEASSFKNPKAERFRAVECMLPQIPRLMELTGTPSPNGLEDIWAQIYLLDQGERLGRNITAYRTAFFEPDKRSRTQIFSYRPKQGAQAEIYSRISDIVISMKTEDYITLPPRIVDDIPVILDEAAQKKYDEMERDQVLTIDADDLIADQAAALRTKLQQIAGGSVYLEKQVPAKDNPDEFETVREVVQIHSNKERALAELIEGLHGEHALIFYAFQHDLPHIQTAAKAAGKGAVVEQYTGPDSESRWNAGEIDLLIAHPASCAYGLNLQEGGHHVIWYGLTDNLEWYQQANKRLHRQGNGGHPVIIHRLIVDGSVDEDIAANIEGKADDQDKMMEALKARIRKAQEVQSRKK